MGYDRGDGFPLDFEPNAILFGSKSRGKPSPRSYPTQRDRKLKYSFLSAVGSKISESLPSTSPQTASILTSAKFHLF